MVSHYTEVLDPKPEFPFRPLKNFQKQVLHSPVVEDHLLPVRTGRYMIHSPIS